jgi:hypothetical protein
MSRRSLFLLILSSLLLCFAHLVWAQPENAQVWTTSHGITSDSISIDCSEFQLPVDVGRLLEEPDPINVNTGELSQTMLSSQPLKITLQPETSTTDTLSTISGCTIDGTEIYLATHDSGDTITISASGNINPPGSSVTLDDPEDVVHLVLRGSTWYVVGGLGSGGSSSSKVITDAVDKASAFQAGDGTSYCEIWGESGVAYIECTCNASPCPPNFIVPTGEVLTISDDSGTDYVEFNDSAQVGFSGDARPYGSMEWRASSMVGDNDECDEDPTLITINGESKMAMHCTMGGAEDDGVIWSADGVTVPSNFDKTADMTAEIRAYLVVDNGAGTKYGNIAIDCVPDGEAPGSYGTAVTLNLVFIAIDGLGDETYAISASALDTDTTGADCDPGDTLYWRYTACDTDATPSTSCTSSTGFENDADISSIRFIYRETTLSRQ